LHHSLKKFENEKQSIIILLSFFLLESCKAANEWKYLFNGKNQYGWVIKGDNAKFIVD